MVRRARWLPLGSESLLSGRGHGRRLVDVCGVDAGDLDCIDRVRIRGMAIRRPSSALCIARAGAWMHHPRASDRAFGECVAARCVCTAGALSDALVEVCSGAQMRR